jgi:hypothetical protein
VLGLLAAAGCNQIWGLDQVDPAPPPPRVQLALQIAKTNAEGIADPNLEYHPITPAPAVELGLLGEPLEPAAYNEVEGIVEYPTDFIGKRWRLVYTLDGGVPREVQWSPQVGEDQFPQLVEPLFGRLERKPVPMNSGYAIEPTDTPLTNSQTRVFTTGIWTEGVSGGFLGGTFNYDFSANAVSLSGPIGAPEMAKLDHAVLAHFQTSGSCRFTASVATFVVPDLMENSYQAPAMQPTYVDSDRNVSVRLAGVEPIDSRLRFLLGARAAPANLNRMQFGYAPSTNMSGFSKPAPEQVVDFFLPGPVMIAFANCTFVQGTSPVTVPALADPPEMPGLFPRVAHVEIANQRMRNLVTLTSGFSAVVASSTYDFSADFPVAAPTRVMLQRNGAMIAELHTDPDGTTLPAGEGLLELTFDVEPNVSLGADYFDVTLYALQGTRLAKQRVYTVTERKVMLDTAFMIPGTEFVFEIRSYRGLPNTDRGNFALNTYPQYVASIFTHTFKVP